MRVAGGPNDVRRGNAGSLGSQPHTYPNNGLYTVTVTVTDSTLLSNANTFKVTVANLPPVVSNNLASQGPIQYSDPIAPVTFSAVDVIPDTLTAATRYRYSPDGVVPYTLFPGALPTGLTLAPAPVPCTNGVPDAFHETCTWVLSGNMNVAPGIYVIEIGVTDDSNAKPSASFNVTLAQGTTQFSWNLVTKHTSDFSGTTPAFTATTATGLNAPKSKRPVQ